MSPAVFQLKAPDETGCLLIAFRMEDSRDGLLVRPKELDASTLYTVIQREETWRETGREIMEKGIWIPIQEKNRAVLVEIVDRKEEIA